MQQIGTVETLKQTLFAALMLAFAAQVAPAHTPEERSLAALVSPCKELTAIITVSNLEPKALEKIGRDFSATYRIRNLKLFYKNPDKLRLEGSSRVYGDALLILNGAARFYGVSKLNIRKREDLEKEPSRRQSLLEYGGTLSAGALDFMEGAYLREEKIQGGNAWVFDVKYRNKAGAKEEGSVYRLWIDPKTRISLKRVWFAPDKTIKATFLYLEPKEVAPGIWLPSRCEIRNSEDALAATLEFKEAKTEGGIADSLFEVAP